MQNELEQLQRAVALTKRSRYGRILASPFRGGYARVLERYCRAFRTCARYRTSTFWGEPFNVVLPEELSIHIARYGYFEEGLTRTLLSYVKPGSVVFDVGAHFGYFSLLASRLTGEAGQVHSFEPTPRTFELLRLNVGHKRNVRLNNVAVFKEDTTLTLKDYGPRHSMFNSLYGVRAAEEYRATFEAPVEFSTRAVRLDSYIAETGVTPNFVKIDAEGAEPEVLAGMADLIRRQRPMISLEVGDWGVKEMAPSRQVVELLLDQGYKAIQYEMGEFVPHRIRDQYEYDNILMIAE